MYKNTYTKFCKIKLWCSDSYVLLRESWVCFTVTKVVTLCLPHPKALCDYIILQTPLASGRFPLILHRNDCNYKFSGLVAYTILCLNNHFMLNTDHWFHLLINEHYAPACRAVVTAFSSPIVPSVSVWLTPVASFVPSVAVTATIVSTTTLLVDCIINTQ